MKKIISLLTLAIVLVCVLTACTGNKEAVATDGSTSMNKVIGALGEAFETDTGITVTYNATGSGAGIIGVRFASDRDIFHVTNNTFYDPSASHYIPGNVNWYIGDVGVTNTAEIANGLDHLQILDQDNIIVKYNRFLGSIIKSYSNINTNTRRFSN